MTTHTNGRLLTDKEELEYTNLVYELMLLNMCNMWDDHPAFNKAYNRVRELVGGIKALELYIKVDDYVDDIGRRIQKEM